MARWMGPETSPTGLPVEADEVARLCGYLPLALALAGAQVADGVSWGTLVQQLVRGNVEFLDHEYSSVFASLGRSVDALPENERTRYLELAVFPEDALIPPPTVARLWQHSGGLDAAESEKLLARFQRKALLKRVHTDAGEHISFHDLQHDFIRIRAESLTALSSLLLDAYRETLALPEGTAGWAKLPADEPYLWQRLEHHLLEAGRDEEVTGLR